MFLCKFFKEQRQNITLFMTFFIFYIVFFSCCSGFFQRMDFIEIYTCIFFNRIYHSNSVKWFPQIHFDTVVYDFCSSQHFLRHIAIQIFCQIHHSIVICICLIQLHQCKFRIVSCIQTFITEHTTNLIYSFHTAYDQSLQI